jgi:hypothetical protein
MMRTMLVRFLRPGRRSLTGVCPLVTIARFPGKEIATIDVSRRLKTAVAVMALYAAGAAPALAQSAPPKFSAKVPPEVQTPGTVQTRIGTLKFFDGAPDEKERGVRLYRTTLFGSWFTALQAPGAPDMGGAVLASVKLVYDQLDFGRGVEAFMAGMPAASVYGVCEGWIRSA